MKKKIIIGVLFVAVMALSLVACGQDTSDANSSESAGAPTEELSTPEITNSANPTEELSTPEITNSANENTDIEMGDFKTSATIEETVLVDENDVKITATGLDYTDYSVELNLLIENNSDKDLSFIVGSMGYSCNAINGYMANDGYMNTDVAAEKKSNETISFSIDELAIYGITEIADIQVGFQITDEDYNDFYSGPRQVKTSIADSYDYATDTYNKTLKSGMLEKAYDFTIDYHVQDEVYNQNGISIVSEALISNKDGEKAIFLEIVNNSSELVYGVTTDILLNELVVYGATWSSDSINPGAHRIVTMSIDSMLDESYWGIFGISEIENFTCSFSVKDADYNELVEPQEVSIAIAENPTAIDTSGTELYNENGIRIISKGLIEDSSDYSDDIHMLLLVENNYSGVISIDDVYDSLSINGFMTDYFASSIEVPSGKFAIIDVEIDESSLEENKITSKEDIKDIEISFEIEDDDYDTIAEPTVSISY